MSAYDEVYLQPARANMGRMLDVAVGSMGFGLGEFYGLFLASGLARRFGAGDYALITGCSGTELAFRVAVEVQAESRRVPGCVTATTAALSTGAVGRLPATSGRRR